MPDGERATDAMSWTSSTQVLVAQHRFGQLVVHRRVEVARHQQRRRVEREAARTFAVGDERRHDLGDVAPHGHQVRAAGSDVLDPLNAAVHAERAHGRSLRASARRGHTSFLVQTAGGPHGCLSAMAAGALTPEELDTLLEDAFVVCDVAAVPELFEAHGARSRPAVRRARAARASPRWSPACGRTT